MKDENVVLDENVVIGALPVDEKISRFTCYAKTGIGYAFYMRAEVQVQGKGEWHSTDRGESVSVWFEGEYDLTSVAGIKDGDHVRFCIEVRAGQKALVRANQEFTYQASAKRLAHYTASGTSFDAEISYKGCKDFD